MLSFFVTGRPQPEPKRGIGQTKSARKYIYKRDRTGDKRRWVENVRLAARKAMHKQKVEMIPAKVGVTVDYDFFFGRAKSNKDKQMVIKPDESRLIEAIDDALEGVCYPNDMQINQHLVSTDYADEGQAEGVTIEIWRTR